jgi:hypothetical protein
VVAETGDGTTGADRVGWTGEVTVIDGLRDAWMGSADGGRRLLGMFTSILPYMKDGRLA